MVDQKVPQETTENGTPIEHALNALWEKAREASLLISTLSEEKKSLLLRIDELEAELKQAKNDAIINQTNLQQLRSELDENGNGHENISLDRDEKAKLQARVRAIITKLDQYLSS